MAKASINQLKDIHLPPSISLDMPDTWVMITMFSVLFVCLFMLISLLWRKRLVLSSLRTLKKIKLTYTKDGEASNFIRSIKILLKNHVNLSARKNLNKSCIIDKLYASKWDNFIIQHSKQALPDIDWHKIWHEFPYQQDEKVYLQTNEINLIYKFFKTWIKEFKMGESNV